MVTDGEFVVRASATNESVVGWACGRDDESIITIITAATPNSLNAQHRIAAGAAHGNPTGLLRSRRVERQRLKEIERLRTGV